MKNGKKKRIIVSLGGIEYAEKRWLFVKKGAYTKV